MKLLLDENLSPRLLRKLESAYPGSEHVQGLGLQGRDDNTVWIAAVRGDFVLVSKDDDFRKRSQREGDPPKVVWLNVGNAGKAEVAEILVASKSELTRFVEDSTRSLLELAGDQVD